MHTKRKTRKKVTAGESICMQMLTIAMNTTNNGGDNSPIVWIVQETEIIKYFPDEKGSVAYPPDITCKELEHIDHCESLKMKFSAYGTWHTSGGTMHIDMSAEVRIFRIHKCLAWIPHYCIFMQPSLGIGQTAHAYIFNDFAVAAERNYFLSSRKFPGQRNWSKETYEISGCRKEQFLELAKPLFIKTGEEHIAEAT